VVKKKIEFERGGSTTAQRDGGKGRAMKTEKKRAKTRERQAFLNRSKNARMGTNLLNRYS